MVEDKKMWQRDIISDLSRTVVRAEGKTYQLEMAKDPAYAHIREGLPILKGGVKAAECIYVGTLDLAQKLIDQFEENEEKMMLNYDYSNIRFPSHHTLWEYSIPEGGRHGSKKEALYILDSKDRVLIWPIVLYQNIWIPGLYWIMLDKVPTGRMKLVGPGDLTEEEKEDFESTGRQVVSYVLSFLKILSCKFIMPEKITSHQSRHERRHNPMPSCTYKSFVVTPLGSCRKSSDLSDLPLCGGYY